jgi:hypothetical protein
VTREDRQDFFVFSLIFFAFCFMLKVGGGVETGSCSQSKGDQDVEKNECRNSVGAVPQPFGSHGHD